MEVIIGRDAERSCLKYEVKDGPRKGYYMIGADGSVPRTVSRDHLKLTIDGNSYRIENLKAGNCTFADGLQVFSKVVKPNSRIELGRDRAFLLPLEDIIMKVSGKMPPVAPVAPVAPAPLVSPVSPNGMVSLAPLERVWLSYKAEREKIFADRDEKAKKYRIMSSLRLALLGISSIAALLIPDLTLRTICAGAAAVVGIIALISALNQGKEAPIQILLTQLDEKYKTRYCCPCCGKPFKYKPFDELVYVKVCSSCKCKYTI